MAIKITGSKVKTVPNLEYIFVRNINITQVRNSADAPAPIYNVDVQYQTYGVGADGNRTFSGAMESITISDFITKANGKPKQLGALVALEEAIADILIESEGYDSATVV